MKSTLLRYFIVLLVLALALGALWLFIGPEKFVLASLGDSASPAPIGGYKVSLQILAMAGLAGAAALIAVWSLLKFLWDLPARLRSGASKRKRGQALEAMEDALIAASAGDRDKARKKAARARTLIDRPALGRIMSAQAAEISGDPAEAQTHYREMLDDEKTRRLGQRGLATLAYSKGDFDAAMTLSKQAYADNKDAKWAFDVLFGAQVSEGEWGGALETLASGLRRKHISKESAVRRRAVLMTAQASGLGGAAATEMAVDAAHDAPGFAPAAALAARLLSASGETGRASKLIEKSWSKAPHPALSLAYRDLQSGESDKVRAKRMKGLIKQNSRHRESIILGAEDAISAGDGVAALAALAPLAKKSKPSARICALAAKAESLCGNNSDARLWAARASAAHGEPDWSDLDPNGPAFAYSPADWRRLVFSYGDSGELIHPRHERFEEMKPAADLQSVEAIETPNAAPSASPSSGPRAQAPAANLTSPPEKSGQDDSVVKAPSPDLIN